MFGVIYVESRLFDLLSFRLLSAFSRLFVSSMRAWRPSAELCADTDDLVEVDKLKLADLLSELDSKF
jgi:hypothetical protein